MPSLIDIRRRIRSVKNTQQITKAMKMVSAAKLRRAQDSVLAARPYSGMLQRVLGNVAAAVRDDEQAASHPLLGQRAEERILLVVVTADRGLAGAFNSNLLKTSQRFVDDRKGKKIELELIGRKGRDYWRKRDFAIIGEHIGIFQKVKYADAKEIAAKIIERFSNEEIDAVYFVVNEFKSVIAQNLTVTRVLPLAMPEGAQAIDYIFEQPPMELLTSLLPKYVETEVYRALLESAAAEHAARMTAMDSATSNAADVIERLTLYMNRVRQASITKEIIEVVSGAAALG